MDQFRDERGCRGERVLPGGLNIPCRARRDEAAEAVFGFSSSGNPKKKSIVSLVNFGKSWKKNGKPMGLV
jgi:hypothetical protein